MENTNLVKLKFLRNGEPQGREYTYISKSDLSVGDTVIVSLAEEGKDAPKGIINQALMKITLYKNDISQIFKILLDNALHLLSKESKGTAIKNIPPFDILKNHIIMLPPLNEQIQIINKLNCLNSLLNNK